MTNQVKVIHVREDHKCKNFITTSSKLENKIKEMMDNAWELKAMAQSEDPDSYTLVFIKTILISI